MQRIYFIHLVLWAYSTSEYTSTRATPFSLVYGAEAMVSIEVMAPLARRAIISKVYDPNVRI